MSAAVGETLACIVDELPRDDRPALVLGDATWTSADVVRTARRLATVLHESGVARGDRVVIAMRNLPEWAPVFWAAQVVGAVAVPINGWSTASELAQVLEQARPRRRPGPAS